MNETKQAAQTAIQKGQTASLTTQQMGFNQQIVTFFSKNHDKLASSLPQHLRENANRYMSVAIAACTSIPKLRECTIPSIFSVVLESARLGLEINSELNHAWIIPFRNEKRKVMEATLMIGYQGYIELSLRNPKVKSIYAQIVYENDKFDYDYGSNRFLTHKRPWGDRGKPVGIYAIAMLGEGNTVFEVMSIEECDKIRAMSQAKDSDAYKYHLDEMRRKAGVRRLQKYLPKSPEIARAIHLDETLDRGEQQLPMIGKAEEVAYEEIATTETAQLPAAEVKPEPEQVKPEPQYTPKKPRKKVAEKPEEQKPEHATTKPEPQPKQEDKKPFKKIGGEPPEPTFAPDPEYTDADAPPVGRKKNEDLFANDGKLTPSAKKEDPIKKQSPLQMYKYFQYVLDNAKEPGEIVRAIDSIAVTYHNGDLTPDQFLELKQAADAKLETKRRK